MRSSRVSMEVCVRVDGNAAASCERIRVRLEEARRAGRRAHLVLRVSKSALRPASVPAYVRSVEPLRAVMAETCSLVSVEVPTPVLRAAVRGALAAFRPEVPVRVRGPSGGDAGSEPPGAGRFG